MPPLPRSSLWRAPPQSPALPPQFLSGSLTGAPPPPPPCPEGELVSRTRVHPHSGPWQALRADWPPHGCVLRLGSQLWPTGPHSAAVTVLWGPRPRNQNEGQSQSGSHCILLENIDIYFSSQLELNTILPGLKKRTKQNQNQNTPKCPQLHAHLPIPSALGWVSHCVLSLSSPPLPRRRVPEGGQEEILKAGQVPGKAT